MPESLLEQFEKHLKIIEKTSRDIHRMAFFVTIAGSGKGIFSKAKEVFEKHHLNYLDTVNVEKHDNVFAFEVCERPVSGEQGVEDLRSALRELGDMGIGGIVGPRPVGADRMYE